MDPFESLFAGLHAHHHHSLHHPSPFMSHPFFGGGANSFHRSFSSGHTAGAVGGSLFDDLLDGPGVHTTTFTTNNGTGTVHITKTVIGDDGSVRREMRFKTPNVSETNKTNGTARTRVSDTGIPASRPDSTYSSKPRSQSASRAASFNIGSPTSFPATSGSEGVQRSSSRKTSLPSQQRTSSFQSPPSPTTRFTSQKPPTPPPQSQSPMPSPRTKRAQASSRGRFFNAEPNISEPDSTTKPEPRGQPDGASASPLPGRRRTTSSSTSSSSRGYQMPTQSSASKAKSSPNMAGLNTTNGSSYTPPSSGGARSRGTRRRPASSASSHAHQYQTRLIQCPLCGRQYSKSVIESHAAQCEGRRSLPDSDSSDSGLTMKLKAEKPYESGPVASPRQRRARTSGSGSSTGSSGRPGFSSRAGSGSNPAKLVECPICNQKYAKSVIEEHASLCGEEVFV